MTLDEIIKQVLELNEKATKGPWHNRGSEVYKSNGDVEFQTSGRHLPNLHGVSYTRDLTNSSLIAYYRTSAPLLAKACQRMKEALEITANLIGTDALQIKFETVWCDPKNVTSNLEQSQKNMETWFIKLRDALADVEKMFEEGK